PQGKLGKPLRNLAAFAKTKCLVPGEEQELTLKFSEYDIASYDDSGVTGHKSCYVLEKGSYEVYAGTDVRSAEAAGSFEIPESEVISACTEAAGPVWKFERMR
ncbi:fibronectin type III-like domain-contianing protein, partial [Blautia hominis]|nr:fibronectin type III-like domain-contianing protein [Blautia hominis]